MSNRLRILVAATKLPKVFDETDLIVESWKLYPGAFSLGVYHHPNSVRVLSKVHGTGGLLHAGFLRRVDTGISITHKGIDAARRFVLGEKPEPKTKPRPPQQTKPCRDYARKEILARDASRSSARVMAASPEASFGSVHGPSCFASKPLASGKHFEREAVTREENLRRESTALAAPPDRRADSTTLTPARPPPRFLGSPITRS